MAGCVQNCEMLFVCLEIGPTNLHSLPLLSLCKYLKSFLISNFINFFRCWFLYDSSSIKLSVPVLSIQTLMLSLTALVTSFTQMWYNFLGRTQIQKLKSFRYRVLTDIPARRYGNSIRCHTTRFKKTKKDRNFLKLMFQGKAWNYLRKFSSNSPIFYVGVSAPDVACRR